MSAYYNENDPFAAAWLRELIKAGLIADGEVDDRDIRDVDAKDVKGFTQCHFFAGIGGWSYALRLAGWPDDRPVWTGSCPCQPYAVSQVAHGGAKGRADARHLWPPFFRLIREREPDTIFGEQVRSAIGWGWWDEVSLDLEAEGYACAPIVLRADAHGAEHERKRLYWVAESSSQGRKRHQPIERISQSAPTPLAVDGDTLTRARHALAGHHGDLLPCDGLSVVVERDALKGYGNAIVPAVAEAFIEAYLDCERT